MDWDDTRILEAEPGDYLTIARKARGQGRRGTWGPSPTRTRAGHRSPELPAARDAYVATIYADAPDAHWEDNPMAYRIRSYRVDARTTLKVPLAAGGGAAIALKPASADEKRTLKPYPRGRGGSP